MPGSECFICGDSTPSRLQIHHIVPRRYGGSDREENLVRLCASCHQAVEKIYDRRFYERLGVEKPAGEIEFEEITSVEDLEHRDVYYHKPLNVFARVDISTREPMGAAGAWGEEGEKEYTFMVIPSSKERQYLNFSTREKPHIQGLEEAIEKDELKKATVHGNLIDTITRFQQDAVPEENI